MRTLHQVVASMSREEIAKAYAATIAFPRRRIIRIHAVNDKDAPDIRDNDRK